MVVHYSNKRAQELSVRISIVQGEVENLKCKESRLQVSMCAFTVAI